jgi:hypothetical protein
MRLSTYFLALLTLVLAGCATTSVPATYTPSETSGKGVVVASITYSGRYAGYSVMYASSDGRTTGKFMVGKGMVLIPYFPDMDFEEKEMKGEVVVAELPAGQYVINGWRVSSGYANIGPTSPVQVRFTVEPGKKVYLGSFHFEQTRSMGLTVTGVKVGFTDREMRDMNVVARKFPGVASSPSGGSAPHGITIDALGGGGNTTMSAPYIPPTPAR